VMVCSGIRSSLVPTIDRAAECDGDLGTINASLRRSLEDRSYLGMLLTASAEHVQSMGRLSVRKLE